MTYEQFQVREWARKAGQEIPPKPALKSQECRKLCAKLLLEETLETIKALGVEVFFDDSIENALTVKSFVFISDITSDLVGISDGLADVKYVANYVASRHGIDMEPIEAEIQRSNNTKFCWSAKDLEEASERGWTISEVGPNEYCVTDSSGKIRKSSSYSPANIAPILDSQK